MIGNIKAQIYSKLEKIIVIEILKKLKKNNNIRIFYVEVSMFSIPLSTSFLIFAVRARGRLE